MSMVSRNILVTGGGGYIGSHMVSVLQDRGYTPIVLDNFSTGYRNSLADVTVYEGSIADPLMVDHICASHPIEAVVHFASSISVGESVVNPRAYYKNNVIGSLSLLDSLLRNRIDRLVFSSTAAVYGQPHAIPIPETHACLPINPYGKTKYAVEQVLEDYRHAFGINYIALRYFNAAGARPEIGLGERHDPETHLIPLVLQVASGRRQQISVFGNDYDTPDGTCIRDYVHVMDLCEAHLLALQRLFDGSAAHADNSGIFNLGNGRGVSVMELISAVRRLTGHPIPLAWEPRRAGDPAVLVADSQKARSELGWQPQREDLDVILSDAWRWEQRWPWHEF